LDDIDLLFSGPGGKFSTPVKELKLKLSKTRAIIFDWDGVFNNGLKSDSSGSAFSEPDAMGVNLLRLSFWLAHHKMPPTAILSGEENKAALYLAKREHFSSVYFKSTNKIKSLHHFMKEHGLAPEEAAKIQYFNERRIQDETILPKDNEDVQHACASCHAFAKPLSWRRTPKDWDYLKAMHQAFFPSIDPSFSRLGRRPAEGERKPEPVDVALEYVKKAAPLETAECILEGLTLLQSDFSQNELHPPTRPKWTV